jgi:hypothetical protein
LIDDWKVFVWFRPDPGSGKESQTPEENPYPFSSRLGRRDGYDNQDLPYKESKSVDLIHWGSLDAQPCVSCCLQDRRRIVESRRTSIGRIRKRCIRLLLSLCVGLRYWTAVPLKSLPPILGTCGLGTDPILAFVPGSPPMLSSVFAPMAFKGHSLLTLFAHGRCRSSVLKRQVSEKRVVPQGYKLKSSKQYAIDYYRNLDVLGMAWGQHGD